MLYVSYVALNVLDLNSKTEFRSYFCCEYCATASLSTSFPLQRTKYQIKETLMVLKLDKLNTLNSFSPCKKCLSYPISIRLSVICV